MIAFQRVTQAMVVPTMINTLLKETRPEKHDLSSLRSILVGGEPISADLMLQARDRGLPVRQIFGQTESSIQLWVPEEKAREKAGAVGVPVFHGEVRVVDEKGRPVRDWQSTTYISSMESSDVFGPMLRAEALRRGLAYAGKVVLLIDGAAGLENLGLINFKDALQIVDFYHALEHAGKVLVALLGSKEHPDYKRRRGYWAKRLLKNGVLKLIAAAREECAGTPKATTVEKELNYFVQNVDRMQYGSFRRQGYFIGSGVIEAGCKTVIGARCKQSGMFWGKPGAENILALRCINSSQRDDAFWKHRLTLMAAPPLSARRAA